jgi:hippurate hydrolase
MNAVTTQPTISAALIARAVAWRRDLHRHPELGYRELRTADFIAAELGAAGLEVHRGLAGTGVVGTLRRGAGARSLGIRADMDALPLQESTGAGHASENAGVMHACGHDGHVAMLMAAALACSALTDLDGTVHFIFQPAEEIEGGARRMVEEGLFRLFSCDAVYALHNWPALPLGTIAVREGAILAALGIFEIVISGRGCHGALPHEGTDVLLAGSHLVTALQSVASRNIDAREAAIVSVTQFRAGDTWNIVPDRCVLRGTTRWFDDGVGNTIERRIRELTAGVAAAFGCEASVRYERKGPATVNDAMAARRLREVATGAPVNLRVENIPPSTGAEDFAFMLNEVPGCYALLGAGKPAANAALHSPQFDFNDDVLPLGAALWVSLVQRTLARRGTDDGTTRS